MKDERPLWQRLGLDDPDPDPPTIAGTRGSHQNHGHIPVVDTTPRKEGP